MRDVGSSPESLEQLCFDVPTEKEEDFFSWVNSSMTLAFWL